MPVHHVNNFPPGTYVESIPGKIEHPFVGTVKSISVNAFGEPVLMIHMIVRTYANKPHESLGLMTSLGFEPVKEDKSYTFWQRVGPMHPSKVRRLNENTYLKDHDDEKH